MAGKLARMYHNNQVTPGSASYSGGTVTVGAKTSSLLQNADVALQVATNLNNAFVKPAGAAVNGKSQLRLNKKNLKKVKENKKQKTIKRQIKLKNNSV